MRASSPHWLRALQYLQHYNPDELDFVAPYDITQNGIADALGITRPHTSLVLKKLITDGFVEQRMLHIKGGRRRRLAYIISPSGIQVVRAC
jgi:DNA-binding MarR family transcriptional regulator